MNLIKSYNPYLKNNNDNKLNLDNDKNLVNNKN